LEAFQKLFKMQIFRLSIHILGFELGNLILKILYVFLLTLPKRSLGRTILFLAFHQAGLIMGSARLSPSRGLLRGLLTWAFLLHGINTCLALEFVSVRLGGAVS
jgi:hypothetical protein